MEYYCFVEGDSDRQFLDHLSMVLQSKGQDVSLRSLPYATKPGKYLYIKKRINSLKKSHLSYLIFRDLDESDCLVERLDEVSVAIPNTSKKNIIIVVREIESWYLAGLPSDDEIVRKCTPNQRSCLANPDQTNKEFFQQIVQRNKQLFSQDLLLRQYCLERFDIMKAKKDSHSFRRFCGMLENEFFVH